MGTLSRELVCPIRPGEQHLLPEDDGAMERQSKIRFQHVRGSDSIGMVLLASPEKDAFSLLFRPTDAGGIQLSIEAPRIPPRAKAQGTSLPHHLKTLNTLSRLSGKK